MLFSQTYTGVIMCEITYTYAAIIDLTCSVSITLLHRELGFCYNQYFSTLNKSVFTKKNESYLLFFV
jgi:hypothetical protein